MSKNNGAFTEAARVLIQDAIDSITNPSHVSITIPKTPHYVLQATQDTTWYIDAGIGGYSRELKSGEEIIVTSYHGLTPEHFKLIRMESY